MSRYYLYVDDPPILFAARLNMPGVITYPVTSLIFDGVTTGAYGDIQADMTLLLGSTDGGDDYGRVRVQNIATATEIPLGRTSQGTFDGEISIADDAYITVLDDYRVWSKIPRIDADGVQYKDTTVPVGTYTSTGIPPVANCGPGTAGTIDSVTSLMTVDFDASDSIAVSDGATISSYAWDVKDGTITVGALTDAAITATFPAGVRWVALTVTDSNDIPHTARCPVFARSPSVDVTIKVFDFEASIKPGGQDVTVNLHEPVTFPDGSLVMIWEDEPFNAADRGHMHFIGWHQSDDGSSSAKNTGNVSATVLHCLDVAGKLRILPGFPQSVESAETITNWDKMVAPTMDKYVHYLLQWHSTALSLSDYTPSGTGDLYPFVIFASEGGSLFDQVENDVSALIPTHHLTCNRQGQLAVNVDPMLQNELLRTSNVIGAFSEPNLENIDFAYTRSPRTHWLRGRAILTDTRLYTDLTDAAPLYTVHCIAPGTAPGQGVSSAETNVGLTISQEDLNDAKGHEYARLNSRFGKINVTPPKDSVYIDVEPAEYQWVTLTLTSQNAAERGIVFDAKRCLVNSITRRVVAQDTGSVASSQFELESETIGKPAVTVIPTGIVIRPVPAVYVPDYGLVAGVQLVAALDGTADWPLYRTADFQTLSGSGGPTWERIDLGITDGAIFSFIVDPFSPGYIDGTGTGTVNGWAVTEAAIYRVEDLFGTTPTATNVHTFSTAISGSSRFRGRTINASFGRYFPTASDNPWLMVVSHYANAAGHTGTWATYSVDGGVTWATEVQISAHYDTDLSGSEARVETGLYLSPKTPGLAYTSAYTSTANPAATDGFVSTDWGATWSQISVPDIQPGNRPAGALHVPWPTNDDEYVVYHGHITRGVTLQYRTKRVAADGTTIDDISPTVSAVNYGPHRTGFGIRAFDNDRRYLVMGATGNDATALTTGNAHALFVSDDNGDTWTLVVGPDSDNTFGALKGYSAAFAADDRNVIYLWGAPLGNAGTISYSSNFGTSFDDRSGNINADFSVDGVPDSFVAICGGPTGGS